MAARFSDEQRRGRLAIRHRLAPEHRTTHVARVADDLVALHSSDPVSVYLSACARLDAPSIDHVADALYGARTLIRHHAMRRTLWVMTPTVARLAHASSTRKLARVERRKLVAALDGDESWLDDAVETLAREISSGGRPLGTRELRERLPALARPIIMGAGTRNEVTMSAHTRALLVAGFEAQVVRAEPRGTWVGSEYAWIDPQTWIGAEIDDPTLDEESASAELADRWLSRFGPGTADDLQWWAGWTKTAVARSLENIGATEVLLDDGRQGWVANDDAFRENAGDVAPDPWVAFLPGLDPTAMGWRNRTWYLADDVAARVTDRNGNIGPTIWADGHVVGGWVQRPDGSIATELMRPLDAQHRRLLQVEIGRLTDVVGERRFRVRFPAPNQSNLLATPAM